MADEEQLAVLCQGQGEYLQNAEAWNAWREQNPTVQVNLVRAELSEMCLWGAHLSGADLVEANLIGADLTLANLAGAELCGAKLVHTNFYKANLTNADLGRADLRHAYLSEANLIGAHLSGSNLSSADLSEAHLSGANLFGANLCWANLSEVGLSGADLSYANVVEANFTGADLTGCRVYGISAWNLKLDAARQDNLIITPADEPEITVDNLEVAQFIYLLLKNERIRHIIDTITSKLVLILGRFTPERRAVLDALREELRQRDYTPVLFDFDKPASRSTLETVSTLAHMARFVIADLTGAKSVLQELQAVVPTNPSVPVQPLILATHEEPGMFDFFRLYSWVLTPCRYASPERLIADLSERVIVPPEAKVSALRGLSPPT